jgi:sulfate-transporting ATPase
MAVMESYVERPPLPGLAGVVRTVWIQRTGEAAYVQRHLPTGGVEIHFPLGGRPHLVGPLTGPQIEVIPAHTTIVGVRFLPGTAPPVPTVLDDLVDQRLCLTELWGSSVDRLVEAMAGAGTPERALMVLQAHLLQEFRRAVGVDRLVVIALAIAITAVLAVVYQRTRFGLATTAFAESERSLALLGWSPNAVALINWMLAGALAALAAIALGQLSTLTVENSTMIILPALAAALVGRFTSFGMTLAGAFAIGVCQALLARYTSVPGLSDSVPLLVIVLLLAARGSALPRRGDTKQRDVRLGSGLSVVPGFVIAAALLVACVATLLVLPDRFTVALSLSAGFGLILLSIVVLTGYTGQLSLAQFVLGGVSAIIAGRLVAEQGWSLVPSVLGAVAAVVALGLVVALPALRTRGMALSVATLGLAVVLEQMVLGNPDVNGGLAGIPVSGISLFGIEISGILFPERYATASLILLAAAMIVIANIRRNALGRHLIAVRSNERSASSLGINVTVTKLGAFAVAAALSSLGGIVIGFHSSRVAPAEFTILDSMNIIALAVIGGMGYVSGALVAATLAPGGLVQVFLHGWGDLGTWLYMFSGLAVVLVVVFMPDGLAKHYADLAKRYRRVRSTVIEEVDDPGGSGHVEARRLAVRDLTVRYGGTTAVHGVTLEALPGQVTAIIGPNGAGKTSLLDAVSGFVRPRAGQVFLGETAIHGLRPAARADAGLGRSFQAVELFDELSVCDNIRVGCDAKTARRYVMDLIVRHNAPLSEAARAAIAEFGLADVLDRAPTELSFGQRRLVGIARAIAREPSALLLDEPAAGLDDGETRDLGRLIRDLAHRRGMAVILVEHDMNLVSQVSDHVVVMVEGKVLCHGDVAEVMSDARVLEAYLGVDDQPQLATPAVQAPAARGGRDDRSV